MNKKAELNTQGLVISLLTIGLVATLFASLITMGGSNYDTTGYDPTSLEDYQIMENISATVEESRSLVDDAVVDKNAFDYLANLWNKMLSPFKFIYRSYKVATGLVSTVSSDLNLLPEIGTYIGTLLIILVIIGLILIKFHLGRQK